MTTHKTLSITIDASTTVTVEDGKYLHLHLGAKTVHPSHLKDLGALLVAKGVLRPWEVQDGKAARKIIDERLEPFVKVHKANRDKPLILSSGDGEFLLTWTPLNKQSSGGQWMLSNPRISVSHLTGHPGLLGYFPNTESGVWKALERILFGRAGQMSYAEIDREALGIAERLTQDIKVVKGAKSK